MVLISAAGPAFFMFTLMNANNLPIYDTVVRVSGGINFSKLRVAFFPVLHPVFIVIQ